MFGDAEGHGKNYFYYWEIKIEIKSIMLYTFGLNILSSLTQ